MIEQNDTSTKAARRVAGIVRGKWSFNEKEYLIEALEFYDEAIYIDPSQVTYRFERENGLAAIEYHGRLLNDLAMLYTFGYAQETTLLAKSLQVLGCSISDPYQTISRDSLGKITSSLDFLKWRSGTTMHLLTSFEAAQRYLSNLAQEHYPLMNKPFQGNQGKGIIALKDAVEALSFARRHFNRGKPFLMLEKQMTYLREWRVYVIDGELIDAYEKQKAEGRIVANVHQGARSLVVDSGLKEELFAFVRAHLPATYTSGVYGVDLAVTDNGVYHVVEINRTPGFRGFKEITGGSFPRLVHERLVKRARAVESPISVSHVMTFLGDTNPGETYQLRNEEKGRENILKARGYDYGIENFVSLLKRSDYTLVNLEAVLTTVRESALQEIKPYLDWSDPLETPAFLKRAGVNAVTLANNHSMDFGAKGLEESIQSLAQAGIDAIGAGINTTATSRALHHHVRLGNETLHIIIAAGFEFRKNHEEWGYYAHEDKPGVNSWARTNARRQMLGLRKAYPEAFIIAFPHWGSNYSFKSERQERLASALLEGGADLIIGHGSHMMQEIERYNGKWIVYGLGNFVFNSPGRFRQHGKTGYGMIARLLINSDQTMWLRFYPIFTDNEATDYQSRFVTKQEFDNLVSFLMPHKAAQTSMEKYLAVGKDEYGLYFSGRVR